MKDSSLHIRPINYRQRPLFVLFSPQQQHRSVRCSPDASGPGTHENRESASGRDAIQSLSYYYAQQANLFFRSLFSFYAAVDYQGIGISMSARICIAIIMRCSCIAAPVTSSSSEAVAASELNNTSSAVAAAETNAIAAAASSDRLRIVSSVMMVVVALLLPLLLLLIIVFGGDGTRSGRIGVVITSCINFLQTGRISLLSVAENIITCLPCGVFRKIS